MEFVDGRSSGFPAAYCPKGQGDACLTLHAARATPTNKRISEGDSFLLHSSKLSSETMEQQYFMRIEKGTICFTCTVNAHATVAYSSQRRLGMKPERMQSVLSRIIFKSAKMQTLMSHINLNSTLTRGSFITHTHTNIERKYFFKHCVTLL